MTADTAPDRTTTSLPISLTLADAAAAVGVSRKVIQRAVSDGSLVARYPTSWPVVTVDELRDWVETLPTHRPA